MQPFCYHLLDKVDLKNKSLQIISVFHRSRLHLDFN